MIQSECFWPGVSNLEVAAVSVLTATQPEHTSLAITFDGVVCCASLSSVNFGYAFASLDIGVLLVDFELVLHCVVGGAQAALSDRGEPGQAGATGTILWGVGAIAPIRAREGATGLNPPTKSPEERSSSRLTFSDAAWIGPGSGPVDHPAGRRRLGALTDRPSQYIQLVTEAPRAAEIERRWMTGSTQTACRLHFCRRGLYIQPVQPGGRASRSGGGQLVG